MEDRRHLPPGAGDRGDHLPARAPQRRGLGHGRRPAWPPSPPSRRTTAPRGRAHRGGGDVLRRGRPEGPGRGRPPARDRGGARAHGPHPPGPLQARHRRHRGPRRGGGPRAGPVVRPAGGRHRRRARGLLPALRRPPRRRGHGAAPPPHRPEPRPRPRAHRAGGGRPRGPAHGPREPPGPARGRPSRRPWRWPSSSPSFPQTCLRNDRRSVLWQWGLPEPDALVLEARFGLDTIASGETEPGRGALRGRGRAGTGRRSTTPPVGAGPVRPSHRARRAGAGRPSACPGHDVVAAFDFDGTLTRGGSVWKFLTAMCGRDAVLSAGISLLPQAGAGRPGRAAPPPTRPRRRSSCAPWRGAPPRTWPSGPTAFGVAPLPAPRTAPRSGPGSTGTGARGTARRGVGVARVLRAGRGGRARRGRRGGHAPRGRRRRQAHGALRRGATAGATQKLERLLEAAGW